MPNLKKHLTALLAAGAMLLTLAACGQQAGPMAGGEAEHTLALSQEAVTLDGRALAEGEGGAVTVSRDILYYEAGRGA